MRAEWNLAARAHQIRTGSKTIVPVASVFDKWMASHFTFITARAQDFATLWLTELENVWIVLTQNPQQGRVLSDIAALRTSVQNLAINTVGYFAYP